MGYKSCGSGRGESATVGGPTASSSSIVKIGRDANNFYMYRTPINSGDPKTAWLPEMKVHFEKLFALRGEIQNAYPQGDTRQHLHRNRLRADRETPLPAGHSGERYTACEDGYIAYSIDPGVTPPNLAAVQELAVGLMRLPLAARRARSFPETPSSSGSTTSVSAAS